MDTGGGTRAAVSTTSEASVRPVRGPQNTALCRIFDCGASVFGKSPKRKAVAKKRDIQPARAILIGDEIRDAEAAHKVGMAFGAVAWGYTNPEALQTTNPEEYFTAVSDIAASLTA